MFCVSFMVAITGPSSSLSVGAVPGVCVLGEGCILTCPRKEDPIVLSLHRWAQRRKEEGRPEEKRVRSSA